MNDRKMTLGQKWVLVLSTIPMVGFGILGGLGTYANIVTVFDRSATALGVVAAGEGATAVLAMVMVGLTMLGQSSPFMVRFGLWALPTTASITGAVVATSTVEAVVYSVTPLAMCVSAEGLALLARRIVVYRTGVDMEAQRRNAEVMQKIAYHSALATNHPDSKQREKAEEKFWKLARKVGVSDDALGASLVSVQRDRMTQGADAALIGMFGLLPALPPVDRTEAVPDKQADRTEAVPDKQADRTEAVPDKQADRTEAVPDKQADRTEAVPDKQADRTEAVPDKQADRTEAVPDKQADRTEAVPDKPAGDLVQRQNVSAFVRGLLTENAAITDREIRERIVADFGPDLARDRVRKAIERARAKLSA